MKYIFDTNAVINFLCNTGDFSKLNENDIFFISFITLIELSVGYKTLEEKQTTELFIETANLILINKELINKTINVRKNFGLKLPDAIIVSSTLAENATLITSDKGILIKATELDLKTYNPLKEI